MIDRFECSTDAKTADRKLEHLFINLLLLNFAEGHSYCLTVSVNQISFNDMLINNILYFSDSHKIYFTQELY